ncbi:hypothetical protein SAMN05444392_101530 [Seinonella peptonophila]|uniref:Uncharacterized protein n=1 Tax=Seinonella peptonophila TaxID=112248 RepID=A0A1M4TLW6_9BACL|nr:hypothetical protein [Seinonella peptonophila]SHE45428.1 hypothetical protein SAMN05444392_101530 [Seinonella peptonophila]
MTRPGDSFVLYGILIVTLYLLLRNWLPTKFSEWIKGPQKDNEEQISGKIPDFLRSKGYQVVEEKIKIPISIEVDGEKTYPSRLYVDFLAEKDGERFIVILERLKRPLKMTGPGLRDYFLPLFLIYRTQGMLYIKKEKEELMLIEVDAPDFRQTAKNYRPWYYLLFFILGMIVDSLSR